jgi:hypothetical protein
MGPTCIRSSSFSENGIHIVNSYFPARRTRVVTNLFGLIAGRTPVLALEFDMCVFSQGLRFVTLPLFMLRVLRTLALWPTDAVTCGLSRRAVKFFSFDSEMAVCYKSVGPGHTCGFTSCLHGLLCLCLKFQLS